jgi:plasmid maintenance system antidote protein VapI
MEPAGLSGYALAKALDIPLPRVNDIVRAKCSNSPEMAVLLSAHFGTSDRNRSALTANSSITNPNRQPPAKNSHSRSAGFFPVSGRARPV